MSMLDTFIMRGEWIDNISTLPAEIQDKVLADIVRFGTGRPTLYDNDPIVFSLVNGYKGSMVNNTNDYKNENGGYSYTNYYNWGYFRNNV